MPMGGARPGAGRKKGTLNKATVERELRAQFGVKNAVSKGILPLDVILSVMRGEATYTPQQYEAARDAAPYLHARLSSAVVTHRDAIDELGVDELRHLLALAERATSIIGTAYPAEIGTETPRIDH